MLLDITKKNNPLNIVFCFIILFFVMVNISLASYSDDETTIRKAIAEKDPTYCQQLLDQSEDQCLADMAVALNDSKWCQSISDNESKIQCLEIIMYRQAVAEKKLDLCNQITALELKSQCQKSIISTQTNAESCNNIEGSDQSFCLDSVAANTAVQNQDITGCEDISDEKTRDNCQKVIRAMPQDSDNDGLPDSQERSYGFDPRNADTDGDGLDDLVEASQLQTDPRKADTDGDGINDGQELASGSDPLDEKITIAQTIVPSQTPMKLINIFLIVIGVLIISLIILFTIIKYKK